MIARPRVLSFTRESAIQKVHPEDNVTTGATGRLRRLHRSTSTQYNSMRRIVIAIGVGTLAAIVGPAFVVTEWFGDAIKRVVIGVIMFLGTLR